MMAVIKIKKFMAVESASGIILIFAAFLGFGLENSPWGHIVNSVLIVPFSITKTGHFPNSFLDIINDGLMTVFFMLISLEVKREVLEGELSTRAKAILPVIAACGGMIVPAAIYVAFNIAHPHYLKGWAIPTATDIAFSLAVLSLLGNRIPPTLKIFLLALALVDDLGAVIIIALFYSSHLNFLWLLFSSGCFLLLVMLNFFKSDKFLDYVIIGSLLWFCFANAGIHSTLAGVVLGFTIPLADQPRTSSLRKIESRLHPWVAYGILPLFVFANAGFSLSIFPSAYLLNTVSMGIFFGLFLGKQLGILSAAWFSVKWGLAQLPHQVSWRQFYGISVLCGIGFTMCLYIKTLTFLPEEVALHLMANAAIVLASLLSSILGYLILFKR
jgi:NhaA family Na+:H+ antiporter